MKDYQKKIKAYIHLNQERFIQLSHAIHENPEVSNEEYYACELLTTVLKEEGFEVQVGIAGHPTGFIATKQSSIEGPTIGLLAEYDALAGIGHACGHNIIGSSSVFAACALAQIIEEVGGTLKVFGTPAEEGGDNGSAKATYVDAGLFHEVDACMMIHPSSVTAPTCPSLALHPIEFEYFGAPAHAAGAPEKGINALDAMIQLYTGINALRQQFTSDIKIHGIITHGGDAPNIIPAYTKARFYIRAATAKSRDIVTEKVINIAKGAALATGCEVAHSTYQNKIEDLIVYPYFNQLFTRQAKNLGLNVDLDSQKGMGSTDAGNVSHVVPTIHPTLKICEESVVAHTEAFKAAAKSKSGDDAVIGGATLLGLITLDLLTNPNHLDNIKQEFEQINK
ncbi:MAG TPA: amidohydrolase [Firmicutes bacterium]|nr:amidohydrolase [Bacillota bacterium]